jgi:hypothetical protein
MAVSALMMALALMGGDPDGVVTTAPATNVDLTAVARPEAPTAEGAAQQAAQPHGLSTDQQIDRWIAQRDPAVRPYADGGLPAEPEARKIHGEFTAGIGTGGYRDYGMSVIMPVGEKGTVALSYRRTENGHYRYGYPDYGYGRSPYFNDGGYAFSGRYDPEAPLEHERRSARPGGLPPGAADSLF